MFTQIREFRKLPGNIRYFILAVVLWTIPNCLISSYATLYMLDQGIGAARVGLINSISFGVKTVLSLYAGYIVNRFGRRMTAGVIDLVSWGLYMFLLSVSRSFGMFLFTSLVNCVSVIGGVATSCFMAEDVEMKDRVKAYNFNTILTSACSFLAPLSGLLITRTGLVPAMRGLYVFAGVFMTASALCKLFLLQETSVGRKLLQESRGHKNPFERIPGTVRYVRSNGNLICLLGTNILNNLAVTVSGLYYVPYLTRYLGFSELTVSFFPFVSTAIIILSGLFLMPHIRRLHRGLLTGIALHLAGSLVLLTAAGTIRELAYLCVALWAVASAMTGPFLNTLIANNLDNEKRTDVYGLFNTVSMLCMFPIGYLSGSFFERAPWCAPVMFGAVYLAEGVIAARYRKA